MEKFNKNTKYSIIKQSALAMIITKGKRFTLNDLLVEMAGRCAEDVPYDRYKQAITETIEEMIKEKQLIQFDGEYGLAINEITRKKIQPKKPAEPIIDYYASKKKNYGFIDPSFVEDEYFDR